MAGEEKRRRLVTAKPSKNGCRTCRIRRVKCDEQRPACTRCAKAGRDCVGYELAATSRQRLVLPNLIPDMSVQSIPTTLRYGVSMSADDSYALQQFATELLPVFTHYSPFLKLPQVAFHTCVVEQSALRSVIAMMHAHRVRITGHDTTLMPMERTPDAGLPQYNQALSAVSYRINDTVANKTSAVPIILSCFFLVCFELFRGDSLAAQQHMSNLRQITSQSKSLPDADIIDELRDKFNLIDLGRFDYTVNASTTRLLGELDVLVHRSEELREQLVALSDKSSDLLAATTSMSEGMRRCLSICLSRTYLKRDRRIYLQYQNLLSEIAKWTASFTAVEERLPLRLQLYGRMQDFFCRHSLLLLHSETSTTQFEADCVQVLRDAKQYLQTFSNTFKELPQDHFIWTDPQPTISVAYNVLRTLYFVSLRSAFRATRTEATDLLYAANRREGTFPSALLGGFATTMNQILDYEQLGMACDGLSAYDMPTEIVNAHEHGRGNTFKVTFGYSRIESQRGHIVELKEYLCGSGLECASQTDALRLPFRLTAHEVVPISNDAF